MSIALKMTVNITFATLVTLKKKKDVTGGLCVLTFH